MVQIDLSEHLAVKAWNRFSGSNVPPTSVEPLKETSKSQVYRLENLDLSSGALIAKRCKADTAEIERLVYQELLPFLPMPALRCYGCMEDENPEFAWLFLEDAGNQWFSLEVPEHRCALPLWLGILHTSAAGIPVAKRLPDHGPRYYFRELQSARSQILPGLADPSVKPDEALLLSGILSQFAALASRWDCIEQFCGAMPRTVVHGDLAEKNMRVRTMDSGLNIFPVDWETAGWAVPAADLELPQDLESYWSVVRESWPQVYLDELRQLKNYGRIFRLLAAIGWASRSLVKGSLEKPLRRMRSYSSWLADAIQAAGFEGGSYGGR